jgi:hypothetical protein
MPVPKDSVSAPGFPVYPILLAAYPPLGIMVANQGQIALSAGARIFIVSLLFGMLVYAVLRLILGSWQRAAPLTAFWLVLFFTYGHVYNALETYRMGGFSVGGITIGHHYYLLAIWALVAGLGTAFLLRRKLYSKNLNTILTTVTGFLVLFTLGQGIAVQIRAGVQANQREKSLRTDPISVPNGQALLPDVYWIILDGYGRSDALLEDYGFDNQPFLEELRKLGFVTPDCTLSNYTTTALSLSSTLNMNYLQTYFPDVRAGVKTEDWLNYRDYILHNPVRTQFKAMGYQIVAFENGFPWAEIRDADVFITNDDESESGAGWMASMTDFEEMYLRTTFLIVPEKLTFSLFTGLPPGATRNYPRRYRLIKFVFDQLPQVPEIEGNKFVMVHMIAPHAPFVFDAQGNFVAETDSKIGYAPEIQYLNQRVLESVRTILEKSKTPPVIVIQGDHGWEKHNRTKILNAYYLPGNAAPNIYPTITPVNTFRLIFNRYFQGQYDLLEDSSLYSEQGDIYNFTSVPPSCAIGP